LLTSLTSVQISFVSRLGLASEDLQQLFKLDKVKIAIFLSPRRGRSKQIEHDDEHDSSTSESGIDLPECRIGEGYPSTDLSKRECTVPGLGIGATPPNLVFEICDYMSDTFVAMTELQPT